MAAAPKRKSGAKSPPKPATRPKSNSQAGEPAEAQGARSDSRAGARGQTYEQDDNADNQDADDSTQESIDTEGKVNEGQVTPAADGGDGGSPVQSPTREESPGEACRRWVREGIEATVAAFRDRARAEYIADHPGCKRRDAHDYAWRRALATFPAPGTVVPPIEEIESVAVIPEPVPVPAEAEPPAPDGLAGLGEIPDSWPALLPNAALPIEVQWVQASRVRVRDGNRVDLSRALSPAPSHAALAWLETAILFPAKWADIVARATSAQVDEREHARRERLALDAVADLLSEMQPAS